MAKVCKDIREMCPKFQFGRCISRFDCNHMGEVTGADATEFNGRHARLHRESQLDLAMLYDFIRSKVQ